FVRLKLINVDAARPNKIVSVNWEHYNQLGQLNFQLGKIGTNINQLAHNANLSMQMGSPMQEEIKTLNEISAVIKEMRSLVIDACSYIKSIEGTNPKK
ncbi:MAG: plasmid mobilization relaxosome protein MobC, partial [Pseudanabaena sp.]